MLGMRTTYTPAARGLGSQLRAHHAHVAGLAASDELGLPRRAAYTKHAGPLTSQVLGRFWAQR